jgi:exodeoxyribonuclease V alpha subunit
MTIPSELHDYLRAGVISADDIAAARLLVEMARRDGAAEPSLLAWLGMCLALRTVRDGHTCVDLEQIEEWAGDLSAAVIGTPAWPRDPGEWMHALMASPALVGVAPERKPFLLDGHRLYLARSLAEETSIATAIRDRAKAGSIRILLGGPGTGKTTQVAVDLVALFGGMAPGAVAPRIALAAPTGKAAARMTEAVRMACERAEASPAMIDAILDALLAEPARTVHKLLGFNPRRANCFEYGAGKLLPYDMVIVDEASMLSSTLMFHLLAAVRLDARVRLVGDPNQLASVDAGTVLGDIAAAGDESPLLKPRITTLTKVHRQESAAILALADAIRRGDSAAALTILESGDASVIWVDPGRKSELDSIEQTVCDHAKRLRDVATTGDSAAVLRTQSELQVLCGHRDGPMGVAGWNARVEKRLAVRSSDMWYVGRPLMVTRNSRALALTNGQVGVVVPVGGRMEALFGIPEKPVHVPVSRLEDIATVHALTIHKSQGSEYGHAVVVLPEQPSRIVTRELLYTGITRARTKVTIIGPRKVILAAIDRRIRRATGLASRLT